MQPLRARLKRVTATRNASIGRRASSHSRTPAFVKAPSAHITVTCCRARRTVAELA
jgi:hypothetical protein